MATKEATARIKINKLLEGAGWRFFAEGSASANIRLEPSVTIKSSDLDALGDNFEKTSKGFIDFLLLDTKGFPLIVLEAKSEDKNPFVGKEQARKYAKSQNCRFVVLSNGNLHYFWDLERGNPYLITSFPTPESVIGYQQVTPNPQRLIEDQVGDDYIVLTQCPNYQSEAAWRNEAERPGYIQVNKLRFLRPYQLKAIHTLQRAVKDGKDRFLFEMATGTGKTLTAAAVIKLFLRSGNARRVLFLVDRLELEDQAMKAFKALLSADFQTVIYKENRDDWRRAEIVVTTVQSLLFNNKYQRLFSPTDFDLVISDEAHRSIGGNARAVFDYFIGYKLGLTATPRDYLKRFDKAAPTTRDPHIAEYDTLTSQDKWNEYADVILANPPFMSPKGGIKPHNRFSVQSKRSEVLFVDYMAEHLTPNGRAGIIVPEGIIFQSQTAYKQLRKMLVEESLVAVVSLPAGVFNPYSGVKTSILILDKMLSKKSDTIAFFKVENDGFGLGAQRREIVKNDRPQALTEIGEYLRRLRAGASVEDFQPTLGLIVAKEKIVANGDYNLSGERYREGATNAGLKWPLVPIGSICVVERGASPRPIHDFITGSPDGVNWIKIGDAEIGSKYITHTKEKVTPEGAAKSRRVKQGDFILSNSMSFGRPYMMATEGCIHDGWLLLRDTSDQLDRDFLYSILGSKPVLVQFERSATGGVVNNLNSEIVRGVQIPLPPLGVQKEIVAEIEGYQKVINGARAVLDNYQPHIPIHPDWPMVKLGEVSEVTSSKRILAEEYVPSGTPFYRTKEIVELSKEHEISLELFIARERYESIKARFGAPAKGDLLVSAVGTIGVSWVVSDDRQFYFKDGNLLWIRSLSNLNPYFLKHCLDSTFAKGIDHIVFGAAYKALTIEKLKEFKIPLPPLATQEAIVAEIEAEQALVAANRELIARFEKKIQATLARIWGEES